MFDLHKWIVTTTNQDRKIVRQVDNGFWWKRDLKIGWFFENEKIE